MRSILCEPRYMLVGGDKTGDDKWYDRMVPVADKLFETHLVEIRKK